MSHKTLSIVIPCFNEQESIPVVVPRTLKALGGLVASGQFQRTELIVVDDSSTDSSNRLLKQFPEVKIILGDVKGRGYGRALKQGFRAATGEWIGFFDMDNSYRPEDLPKLIAGLDQPEVDFVMGTRAFSEKGMSFTRGLGNWFYKSMADWLYGSELTDVCSGYRVFHRKHLDRIMLIPEEGLDFSIYLTLEMINQNVLIKPVPIQYDERIGHSKLSVVTDGLAFLKVLMTLKMRRAHALEHRRV